MFLLVPLIPTAKRSLFGLSARQTCPGVPHGLPYQNTCTSTCFVSVLYPPDVWGNRERGGGGGASLHPKFAHMSQVDLSSGAHGQQAKSQLEKLQVWARSPTCRDSMRYRDVKFCFLWKNLISYWHISNKVSPVFPCTCTLQEIEI